MAIINIDVFSDRSLTSDSGNSVKFDGIFSASPRYSNTVTRRPVEDGFNTNDAIHVNATVLDVTIMITDTPQNVLDNRALTNLANATGTKTLQSYTKKQLERLKAISVNKETVTIKTMYDTYFDYFLEGFGYSETSELGLMINFTLIENRTDEEETTTNFDDSIGIFS